MSTTVDYQPNPGQTAGPADPNAPLAQKFYTVLTVISSLISTASIFGMITGEQAASLGQVGATATALVTSVGTAIAAFRTRKQIKNGTFDEAPPTQIILPTPPPNPVENVFQNVTDLKSHLDAAVDDAVSKVKTGVDIMQGAISLLPGGVTPADGVAQLLQAMGERHGSAL